jgi:hypothetical protein
MKNRAKCKLCSSIVESFHSTDYVQCQCGEIIVDGGDSMRCAANNWQNFLRVDDEGNEIITKVKDSIAEDPRNEPHKQHTDSKQDDDKCVENHNKPSKKEIVEMLENMIKSIDDLPNYAKEGPINHYDYESLLLLVLAFFKESCKEES